MDYMPSIADRLRKAAKGRALRSQIRGLPPRVESFVGRESVLGQILSVLGVEPAGRRLLVHGRPGVGKTAIALEVAHRVVDLPRYDYVVWLDCQPFILGSDSADQSPYALGDFASVTLALSQAVGAVEGPGCTIEQRSHVLRNWLSQHRTLLILDGVDRIFDSSLRNLLERLPFTVDIIVTCRIAHDWGQQLQVLPFSAESNHLRRIVQTELRRRLMDSSSDDDVRRIERASEGIPMTALWLIALLSRGGTFELIETEMKRQNMTLSEYYFVEAWNIISADSALRKIAISMSSMPELGSDGLTAALQPILAPTLVSRGLRQLESLNVLENSGQVPKLQRAVRDYILGRLGANDPDFQQTALLAIDHLRVLSDKAISLKDWAQCFAALEPIQSSLVAALNICRDIADDSIRLQGLRLLDNVAYYLFSSGLWDELLSCHRWSLQTALRHGNLDSILEVSMTWIVRVIDRRAGESAAAKFMAQTEITLREGKLLPPTVQMKLEVARAVIRDSQGSVVGGGTSRLVELANKLWHNECPEWACRAMLQAGNFASEALDATTAEAAFRWVTERAVLIRAPWAHTMVALSRGNLGILCNRTAAFERARALLRESIPGLPQLYDVAVAKAEMARACYEIGRIREARQLAGQSHALADAMRVKPSIMESELGWDHKVGADLINSSMTSIVFREFAKRLRRQAESLS